MTRLISADKLAEAAGRRADQVAQQAPQTQTGSTSPWQLGPYFKGVEEHPEKSAQMIAQAHAQGGNRQNLDSVLASIKAQAKNVFANPWKGTKGALQKIVAPLAWLVRAEQLVSTAASLIRFSAEPAARIDDLAISLPHAHAVPFIPVPLPTGGPVQDIPILSGATKTFINGLPAARCGDIGFSILCGVVPFYEIFTGSSSVWIEGARAARESCDITRHCMFSIPIGLPFGMLVTGSSNVIIGGMPMPSLTSMAIGKLFRGISKLVRRATAKRFVEKMLDAQKIYIGGDAAFKAAVKKDLIKMASNETGRANLNAMRKSGKNVEIWPHDDKSKLGADSYPNSLNGASRNPDGSPGSGVDSTIRYNPETNYGKGTPSDAILNHEMGHCVENAQGTNQLGNKYPQGSQQERQWTDPAEKENIQKVDNPYRNDSGLPQRQGHKDQP